jgi:hypothetical protein
MADPVPVSFNNTWRAGFTVCTFLFNAGIIVFCLLKGEPTNSLHSSAMSWAFFVDLTILAGLGIGSLVPSSIAETLKGLKG